MNNFTKKTAALHNLGCKVNSYETEAMQELLIKAGYEIVPFSELADIYVINTCSVTNIADHKSRQMIHKAKKKNPDAIVVAAGCYVQTAEEELKKDLAVDIVIGNNKKGELLSLIRAYKEEQGYGDVIDINDGMQVFEELLVDHTGDRTRAFLKIQDGCNQFCSYCIIPYARGRIRSRKPEEVIREVSGLALNGTKEIVLTGIHLSSYGKDIGSSLLELIREIHTISGVERIRLGSLEPRIITEEFVKELSQLKKVCPHFHLSLQSGSDSVLKRMNRTYTTEDYLRGCEILRRYYEHPAITTDIIVGFPGETQEEFAETLAYIRRIRFYEVHVFKYSKRKNTPAAQMPDQIEEGVKTQRSKILSESVTEIKEEFISYYTGKTVSVLFEQEKKKDGKSYYEGFTPEYVKVRYESGRPLWNQLVEVVFSRDIV